MSTSSTPPRRRPLRYISPVPNGFLIRITRAIAPVFTKTEGEAVIKRSEMFQTLFDRPYSDNAANSFPYATNKGSDRRGVEFVHLKSGKEFWQVKLREYDGPMDRIGRTRIRKFFVSKWGHKGGYDEAVKCKDENERLNARNGHGHNHPPQGDRENLGTVNSGDRSADHRKRQDHGADGHARNAAVS